MASESTMKGVNGYASQQPYEQQMPTHGSTNTTSGSFNAESSNIPSAGNDTSSGASEGNSSVPKDEVGWYFVEQYYTTLSKTPEKLHVSPLEGSFFTQNHQTPDYSPAFLLQTLSICIRS